MFLSLFLAFALSEEEEAGIYSPSRDFLPLLAKSRIDGRGYLPDYPNNRIPIKRFFRFVSSYGVPDDATYGLVQVFGYVTTTDNHENFLWNFTSYGVGGRLSNEDQYTFAHLCDFDAEFEPGTYQLNVFAQVSDKQGTNFSLVLFNETAEFYEVLNLKDQVGTAVLYVTAVGVLGSILYVIFNKDNTKPTSSKKKAKARDYSELHDVDVKNPLPRQQSPNRSGSPSKRNKSPR